jgi:hypothetical protein
MSTQDRISAGTSWFGTTAAVAAIALMIAAALALTLLLMGRVPWCTCGTIKLWHGAVFSSENSQHLTDWYTPSHVIHGMAFYFLLWLVGRNWPLGLRFVVALALEASWEVLENTDFIINRYREDTLALDYYGDSVINSVMDFAAAAVGFWLARLLPVWASIALVIVLEVGVGIAIRDNLILNIIMLLTPLDWIKEWQLQGHPQ